MEGSPLSSIVAVLKDPHIKLQSIVHQCEYLLMCKVCINLHRPYKRKICPIKHSFLLALLTHQLMSYARNHKLQGTLLLELYSSYSWKLAHVCHVHPSRLCMVWMSSVSLQCLTFFLGRMWPLQNMSLEFMAFRLQYTNGTRHRICITLT